MSDFKLEPWEVPTSSVSAASGEADAELEFEIWGQKRHFLLRVVELRDQLCCSFIREKHSATVGSWMLVFQRDREVHVWHPHAPPPLEDVALGIEEGGIELARFCVVAHDKQTRRALTRSNGESQWLSVTMENQEPFHLTLSQTAFFQDGRAHLECVEEELARPDSDARFAANWLRWSREKKQRHLLGEAGFRELQTLMHSLLQSQQWLWERGDRWIWTLSLRRELPNVPFDPGRISDRVDERFSIFLDFSRLWMSHFEPPLDHPELCAHRCVRAFAEWGGAWPTVEVAACPSMHEYLEALLYLREWLQQNAPDRMDLLA